MSLGTSCGSQGSGTTLCRSHGKASPFSSASLAGSSALRDHTLRRPSCATQTRRCDCSSAHSRLALPQRHWCVLPCLIIKTLSRASGWSMSGVSTAASLSSSGHLLTVMEFPIESSQCPRMSLAKRSLNCAADTTSPPAAGAGLYMSIVMAAMPGGRGGPATASPARGWSPHAPPGGIGPCRPPTRGDRRADSPRASPPDPLSWADAT
mmetsp:Transcript_20922/g.62378  ORF Transcript_20922/g.62378 Transcript_20922/m.62378 type:complete len:208 (-) Transcript_20922:2-625(-)